jgi:hypothetical protein
MSLSGESREALEYWETGELRSERWEGASKARGRERLHREALEYWV